MVQQITDVATRRRFCARLRPDRLVSHTRADISRVEAILDGAAGRVAIADLLDYVEHRDLVRAVAIDRATPAASAIADGSYWLTQPLYVFVKTAQIEQVNGLDAFLRALLDDDAIGEHGYLPRLGLVPLPPTLRVVQRARLFGPDLPFGPE
jgi:phosphate transport system substrate-binding protein